MVGYYFHLALRSLSRTPVLTALMILAIGVGIGTAMTTLTIFRTAAGNPIPERSTRLFTPQIDDCGPRCDFGPPYIPADRLPFLLSYQDAGALMRISNRQPQAAMYATVLTLTPPRAQSYPMQVTARATYADFFSMFQVTFRYGAPWSSHQDDAHAAVAVITREMNERLFGGTNSVGKTVRLDGRDYRITGVMDQWQVVPRFYDLFPDPVAGRSGLTPGQADAVYVPFTVAIDRHFIPITVNLCPHPAPNNVHGPEDVWRDLFASQCNFVQLWVELATPSIARHYRELLGAYAVEQKLNGRFPWPPRIQLRDVRQWLRYLQVVPTEVRVAVIVAFGLLAACLVNATSIVLARFLPRALDVGVRRTVGATRRAIFLQHLVEVAAIGVLGAGLGLLLMALGQHVSRALLPPNLVDLVRFDGVDAVIAVGLSVAVTMLTGLYPTWRMTHVQPALQLKVDGTAMIAGMAALHRNVLGPVLIAVQVALTLAILGNALFIVHKRLAWASRPTGIDESSVFAIHNDWGDVKSDIAARVQADLAALRLLPGVVDAYVTNSYPLSGIAGDLRVTLDPTDKASGRTAGIYLAGPHALRTLGLHLVAGRWLAPEDVQVLPGPYNTDHPPPGGLIVTRQLADQLSPGGHVLGRLATIKGIGGDNTAPIVGVIQDLQVSNVNPPGFMHLAAYSSVLVPYLYAGPQAYYVVRARSAAMVNATMKAAIAKLYAINRGRVIVNAESLPQARRRVYRADREQAVVLTAVSAILLAMTGWGTVGLASCSVNQRRRQIGIRRALGATHAAILRRFQSENLLIAGAGVFVGLGLAITANLWMVSRFQMDRLDFRYALLGALIVMVLGQLATLWPALRAASVPPAEAARSP
jgi:putative ABC transport system permease protein